MVFFVWLPILEIVGAWLSIIVLVNTNGVSAVLELASAAVQVISFAPLFKCIPASEPVPLNVVAPVIEYERITPVQLSVTVGSNSEPFTR